MNRKRQYITTILAFFCMVAVIGAAILGPKVYNEMLDKNQLGKIDSISNELETFQTSYRSFSEKLKTVAFLTYNHMPVSTIDIVETDQTVSAEELTRQVNVELRIFAQTKIMDETIMLNENDLLEREMQTRCSKDSKDGKGIAYWKLVYKSTKYEATIFMDAEFHKLYCVNYSNLEPKKSDSVDYNTSAKKVLVSWPQKIADYYGINEDLIGVRNDKFETTDEDYYVFTKYDNGSEIVLRRDYERNKDGTFQFKIGILGIDIRYNYDTSTNEK